MSESLSVNLVDDDYIANPHYEMSGMIQITITGKSDLTYHHHCLSCGACLNSSGYEPSYVRHEKRCVKRVISKRKAEAAFKAHIKLNQDIADMNKRVIK